MKEQTKFQLRGGCQQNEVDTFFVLQQGRELLGYRQSKMFWSGEDRRWNIANLVDNKNMAYTNDTSAFPIGTRRWYFINGSCNDPGQLWRKMNLHLAVQQPGYFCCEDGLCIDSELKCDYHQHCSDYSDEMYCDMVKFSRYYDKEGLL